MHSQHYSGKKVNHIHEIWADLRGGCLSACVFSCAHFWVCAQKCAACVSNAMRQRGDNRQFSDLSSDFLFFQSITSPFVSPFSCCFCQNRIEMFFIRVRLFTDILCVLCFAFTRRNHSIYLLGQRSHFEHWVCESFITDMYSYRSTIVAWEAF